MKREQVNCKVCRSFLHKTEEHKNKKTQAFFTLNGKRTEMTWTTWVNPITTDENAIKYYKNYAKWHKVDLQWVKVGKRKIYEIAHCPRCGYILHKGVKFPDTKLFVYTCRKCMYRETNDDNHGL
jgi:hypothetical protein